MRVIRNVAAGLVLLTLAGVLASAADKGRIAFASDRSGSWQIYTVNPDGSDLFQVTNLPPTDDDGLFPSLSPDGRRVLFNYNAGEGPDLFVINVDGSGLQQLTTDHRSFGAHWSPDGKTIAFSNITDFDTVVIATMTADGSGTKTILTSIVWESVFPIYTPDAKHIVFGSQMGGLVSAAWIMNADGSHQRRLTPAALKAQPWAVSPDGRKIAGYFNQDSPPALETGIFVMNLNGSGRQSLAAGGSFHHDLYPTYSPDGKSISFVSDRFSTDITQFTYGTFDILTMDADGENIVDVVSGAGFCPNDGNCVTPSWGASAQE
jgi:Tol biopolymer transport system component